MLRLVAVFVALTPAVAYANLTEAPRLAAVYDTILSARFDQVDAQLASTCPPAPVEACKALAAVSVWWQIQLDPSNRDLDARLNELASAAIAAAEAWSRRDPKNAEAWFYLAGSYAPLVQWRALRGERLAAARDANRIREAAGAPQVQLQRLSHGGLVVHDEKPPLPGYADRPGVGSGVPRWLTRYAVSTEGRMEANRPGRAGGPEGVMMDVTPSPPRP